MATQSMSPGGALLRSSRMFSLPPPIPSPAGSYANVSSGWSKSATRHTPTYQVVSTPTSARLRGDWGFKRSFPLKVTTKSTTPAIRVKEVDTLEQVTDFVSASDHALSLQKFQEMNIPMVQPFKLGEVSHTRPIPSVFEGAGDVSAVEPADRARLRSERWKFSGPWLAGMVEGDFQKYIQRSVRPRRAEFRLWLKGFIAEEQNKSAATKALDRGTEAPPAITAKDVTDSQLVDFLRQARNERENLFSMVGEFLDLAPLAPAPMSLDKGQRLHRRPDVGNPYATDGPPQCHPSAGISYLRTGAYLENHPLYGPQKSHKAVPTRLLFSRFSQLSSLPKIAVGGFVTPVPRDQPYHERDLSRKFDSRVLGGRKTHVEPFAATVDADGFVMVHSLHAQTDAERIARELVGDDTLEKLVSQDDQDLDISPYTMKQAPRSSFRSVNYGL